MTIGNQIVWFLLNVDLGVRLMAGIHKAWGGVVVLRILSLVNLRGRTTSGRRRLEYQVMPRYPITHGRTLLVGIKPYNYHYIGFYRIFGDVDVVEPGGSWMIPQGVRLIKGRLEDVHLDGTYDLIHFFGVYGYGLNDEASMRRAAQTLAVITRPGAAMIFGFNKSHDPLGFNDLDILQDIFCDFVIETLDSGDALDDVVIIIARRSAHVPEIN